MPVPALKLPLFLIPPWKVTVEFTVLVQLPPGFIVTNPFIFFVPLLDEITNFPLAPPPMVVVPVTVRL